MNTFEIEDIVKTSTLITVLPVIGEEFTIDRTAFEIWADKNQKRDWGTNDGDTGEHTWSEYYDGPYFEADLIEYCSAKAAMEEFDSIVNALKS